MTELPGGLGPIIANKVILAVLTATLAICTLIYCLFHPRKWYEMKMNDDN